MPKQKIEIELDVPAGFRVVENWRHNPPQLSFEKLEPEIRTGFINVYPGGSEFDCAHATRKNADASASRERIACVEVKYEVPPQ